MLIGKQRIGQKWAQKAFYALQLATKKTHVTTDTPVTRDLRKNPEAKLKFQILENLVAVRGRTRKAEKTYLGTWCDYSQTGFIFSHDDSSSCDHLPCLTLYRNAPFAMDIIFAISLGFALRFVVV